MFNLLLGADPVSSVTIPADWYSPIITFISNSLPAIIAGFCAILAFSAGVNFFMKIARKVTKG